MNERPFDPKETARQIMRSVRTGALATLDPETGAPFASLVTVAPAGDGAPLMLLSDLARHTRNLKADDRVSLLLSEDHDADPLAAPRLTVIGRISQSDADDDRARFLAAHPPAAGYAGFADFHIFRLAPESAHLVAGFGRITDLARDDLIDP